MKKLIFLLIPFLLFFKTAFASTSCTRDDFIMGAITFEFYDSGSMLTLKNNGFNWLKMWFNGDILLGVDTPENYCLDFDDDGKGDYLDCLNIAELFARQQAGWNFKYNILLGYDSAEEVSFTGGIIDNMKVYDIGIYEVGGELDMEFVGIKPCKDIDCNEYFDPDNPLEWNGYWEQIAELIKPITETINSSDPDSKILLHLANSHKPDLVGNFTLKMISEGVIFDYIGFTVYQTAYGDNNLLSESIERAEKYSKKVILSEFGGYPSSDCGDWALPFGWPLNKVDDYSLDETGQANYLRDELNFLKSNSNVLGVIYVGPLEAINFFCPETKNCSLNLGDVDGDDKDDYYCWTGSLIRPDGTLKPALTEIKNFMCPVCNNDGVCEVIVPSKPALQEFRKEPDIMLGVVADKAYSMMEESYIWKDSVSEIEYSNVYDLFNEKDIDWTRTMLFWDETEGEYNLDYVTKTLRIVNDTGLNITVVLGLSDGWGVVGRQPGPECVNYNKITVPSRYDPDAPCLRYDSLTWEEKKSVMEEYAFRVSEHFNENGIDVKIYEIGNEIDYGIAGVFPIDDPHKHDVNWYKNNIWPKESEIIKSAIKGIKDADPDAKIQIHIANFLDKDFVYEFFKFMLDPPQNIEIDYAALSYYPSLIPEDIREVYPLVVSPYFLTKVTIDGVTQRLFNDGYDDVKFVIAEFSYPSQQDSPEWFSDKPWKSNPIEGYNFTPDGQANWLHDFYDAIYSDENITGSFWLWPEAADGNWTNFCSVFYSPDEMPAFGENYLNCPQDCCNSDHTASYDSICHGECGASRNCSGAEPSEANPCCSGCYYTDITGPNKIPDGVVDIRDIALAARAFGSTPGNERWEPDADINNDGEINIKDIARVARKFGATC